MWMTRGIDTPEKLDDDLALTDKEREAIATPIAEYILTLDFATSKAAERVLATESLFGAVLAIGLYLQRTRHARAWLREARKEMRAVHVQSHSSQPQQGVPDAVQSNAPDVPAVQSFAGAL